MQTLLFVKVKITLGLHFSYKRNKNFTTPEKKKYIYIYIYTVGTESIQTPLNFSLFVILQPFAKII